MLEIFERARGDDERVELYVDGSATTGFTPLPEPPPATSIYDARRLIAGPPAGGTIYPYNPAEPQSEQDRLDEASAFFRFHDARMAAPFVNFSEIKKRSACSRIFDRFKLM